jgi:hypothetical protein
MFQDGQRHLLFFDAPPPAFWLMTIVAKNLEVTFKEHERECIRKLLSN